MAGEGVCMAGGVAAGACVAGEGGMHGWLGRGACMAGEGACMAGGTCMVGGVRRYYGYGIRSMSGRYPSYWNAFLFKTSFPCFLFPRSQ